MQAARKCTFAQLAGAKAPAPYAACGRKASSKTDRNGTGRGGSRLERFAASTARAVLLDSTKPLREAICPGMVSVAIGRTVSIKLFVRSPAIPLKSPPARLSARARVSYPYPQTKRQRAFTARIFKPFGQCAICVSLLPPQEKADSRQRPLTTVGSLRFVAQIIRCPLFLP